MPLLAYSAPQTPTDWVIFGSILAIIIAFGTFTSLQHRRRRAALIAAARGLGLESVPPKSPDAAFINHAVKGQRAHKLLMCSVGIVGDRAARLSEFTFLTGSGKSTHTNYNLQLSLECPESWPVIHLCDRPDFLHRPLSQLFKSPKPVIEDSAFDKRWQVQGPDIPQAAAALTPELRDLLLGGEKTEFWSIQDGWLTCTWRRACKPADLPGLLARTRQVRQAMAAALGE